MESNSHHIHARFENPHTTSPNSVHSPRGVSPVGVSPVGMIPGNVSIPEDPHSPTTGQIRTTSSNPEVVYALPQQYEGDYEVRVLSYIW